MNHQKGPSLVRPIIALAVVIVVAAIYEFWPHSSTRTGLPQSTATAATTTSSSETTKAVLVKGGTDYDLYISMRQNNASTTGQYFLLNKTNGKQIQLGGPFVTSQEEVVGYLSMSITALIFSGDNKYVSFDYGTSVEREWSVFLIPTGKKITSFCGMKQPLFWNNYAIYLGCDRSGLNTAFESGAPDIEAENLLTNATTTLVAASISGGHNLYSIEGITTNKLDYASQSLTKGTDGSWGVASDNPLKKSIDLTQKL